MITLGPRGYFFLLDTDGRREEWDPYQTVSSVHFILGSSGERTSGARVTRDEFLTVVPRGAKILWGQEPGLLIKCNSQGRQQSGHQRKLTCGKPDCDASFTICQFFLL